MWTFQPGDGRGLSRSGAEAAAKRAQLALCREVKGGDGSGKDGASGGPRGLACVLTQGQTRQRRGGLGRRLHGRRLHADRLLELPSAYQALILKRMCV